MVRTLLPWLFLGFLILTLGCGDKDSGKNPVISPELADSTGTVAFADAHLDSAVRQALDKPDIPLTPADLLTLTEFEARGAGIADLHGIERLKNLTILDLTENQIRDIAPLGMTTQLTFLDLSGNQIEDISPLATLVHLEILLLDGNAIRSLAPLLQLTALQSLELTANPLDSLSLNQVLPALQSRGVQVTFQPETGGDVPSVYQDFDIAYVGKEKPGSARTDIFLRSTAGGPAVNLTREPAQYSNLCWSPDGSRIAFVADRYANGIFHIYAMDTDSGHPDTLSENISADYLRWSPDGSRIAFSRSFWFPSQNLHYSEIFTLTADGSRLTDDPDGSGSPVSLHASLVAGWHPAGLHPTHGDLRFFREYRQ